MQGAVAVSAPGGTTPRVARFRRRYEQVMGDREPQVTDKQFLAEMRSALDAYYQASETEKEAQLAHAEKIRVARLTQYDYSSWKPALTPRRQKSRESSRPRKRATSGLGRSKGSLVQSSQQLDHPGRETSNLTASAPLANRDNRMGDETLLKADCNTFQMQYYPNNSADQVLCDLTVDQLYGWASSRHGSDFSTDRVY